VYLTNGGTMHLVIRNDGTMAGNIIGADSVGNILRLLKTNVIEVSKAKDTKCQAVYRLRESVKIPLEDGLGNKLEVFLWKHDTTVALFI
jgi:hypothetical protein